MEKSTCVYCGAISGFSDEHWFPEAFGRFKNFNVLRNTVCRKCNSESAVAEQALARYGVTGLFRSMHAIKGKKRRKGSKEKPAHDYPLKELPPQKMLVSLPGLACRIYGEFNENQRIRPVPQLIIRRGSEITAYRVPTWVKGPATREKWFRKEGLEAAHIEHILARTEEDARNLAKMLFPDRQIRRGNVIQQHTNVRYDWTAATSILHARAVCKISFHYLLSVWSKHYSGREREFGALRNFIQGQYPNNLNWEIFARRRRDRLVIPPLVPGKYCHEVTLRRTDTALIGTLRFFVGGTHGMAGEHWEVTLGKPPGTLAWNDSIAHTFIAYPERTDKWEGELIPGDLSSQANA